MKKKFAAFTLLLLLPALAACGGKYDYSQHISESRSDIFRAETEEFTLTLSCISREYPFASDGIACPKSDLIEISLVPVQAQIADYSVYVIGDVVWGGETSFRNTFGDFFYSESVESFPQESVNLRVEWGEETREITATSVKNGDTMSVNEALGFAVSAEKEHISRMTKNGVFCGEFYVRLLRRDKNYYYVGIVDPDGETLSLLLDSETGEVLARRNTRT